MVCVETSGGPNGLRVATDRHAGADCGDGSISAGEEPWLVPSACCRFVSPARRVTLVSLLPLSRSVTSANTSRRDRVRRSPPATHLLQRQDKRRRPRGGGLRTIFRLFCCDFSFFFVLIASLVEAAGIKPPPRVGFASLVCTPLKRNGEELQGSRRLAHGLDNDWNNKWKPPQ